MKVNPARPNIIYTVNKMPSEEGFNDALTYAAKYKSSGDSQDAVHTYEDIAEATGLDLSIMANPATIEQLWDTNGDTQVDTKEMANGIAHLDASDDSFDGVITEEGRQVVEDFLGKSIVEDAKKVFMSPILKLIVSSEKTKNVDFEADSGFVETVKSLREAGVAQEDIDAYKSAYASARIKDNRVGENQRKAILDKKVVDAQHSYQEQLKGFYISSGMKKRSLDTSA